MKSVVQIPLKINKEQAARLSVLQAMFASACNDIVDIATEQRCWNRVALHHLTYRKLRERFPDLGSQMSCNVIYAVSRICRRIFQNPQSPFSLAKIGDGPLPQIRFQPTSPVFFDRHTLSIKEGQLSLYALDGRLRFRLDIDPELEARFHGGKLREIVLTLSKGRYLLSFRFHDDDDPLAAWQDDAGKPVPRHLQVTATNDSEARVAA